MITALMTLAAAHAGSLAGGAAVATGIEVAIPWMTRAHRVRQATNVARRLHRRRHNAAISQEQLRQVRREAVRGLGPGSS